MSAADGVLRASAQEGQESQARRRTREGKKTPNCFLERLTLRKVNEEMYRLTSHQSVKEHAIIEEKKL